MGNPHEVLAELQNRLAYNPTDFQSLLRLSEVSLDLRDWAAAEQIIDYVLAGNPHWRDAWIQRVRVHRAIGPEARALATIAEVLQRFPDDPYGLLELVYLHRRADRLVVALREADRLVAAHPTFLLGWLTRGAILHHLMRFAEAEVSYRRALDIDPTSPAVQTFLGYTLLLTGRWREGFGYFEARRRLPDHIIAPTSALPWPGVQAAPTGRILVWNDQGYGDAIQFLRFIPWLMERGYKPVLRLEPALQPLAALLVDDIAVIDTDDEVPEVDYHVTLGSLPYHLMIDSPAQTWRYAYLRRPMKRPHTPSQAMRVGVVWAGGAAHENDFRRSLSLATLAPLFECDSIEWISLQVGPRAQDRAAVPFGDRLHDAGSSLHHFAETAAVLAGLDLLITVDTAILHLAGAMDVPVWALLAAPCDWRWLTEGDTTGWYPSARLFRQESPGEWLPVISAVYRALSTLRNKSA